MNSKRLLFVTPQLPQAIQDSSNNGSWQVLSLLAAEYEVARKAGFPGIIGHGLCTMAFTSKAVIDSVCDSDPERLERLFVRFAKPVIPGQTIETRIWAGSAPGDFEFETAAPDGGLVISAARAWVRS